MKKEDLFSHGSLTLKQIIGRNIRYIRKKRNKTQRDLSEALHVEPACISNYENGRTEPNALMLLLLSDYLEASPNDFLYLGDIPKDGKFDLMSVDNDSDAAIRMEIDFLLATADRHSLVIVAQVINVIITIFKGSTE